MSKARLTKYGLHFTVDNITDPRVKRCCEDHYDKFAQFGMVKKPGRGFVREVVRHWALRLFGGTQFNFHINSLGTFLSWCMGVGLTRADFEVIEAEPITNTVIPLDKTDTRVLRDYQEATIEFFQKNSFPSKVVTLATGLGKSAIMTSLMHLRQQRIVIIIRPMFIAKWQEDLMAQLGFTKKDICIIQGSKDLRNLIAMDAEDQRFKAVIISNKTMKSMISDYETLTKKEFLAKWDMFPQEFMRALGTDTYYVDERHMDLHLNMLLDLTLHAYQVICATGTLIHRDTFTLRIMQLMHPSNTRIEPAKRKAYTHVFAHSYIMSEPSVIRSTEWGSTTYSHIAFEKSMMRSDMRSNYYDMIKDLIRLHWLKHPQGFKSGDRCLVFCSTVDMCTDLRNYLDEAFDGFVVKRYTQEDTYEDLMSGDIVVSTVLSAGTAVDIPNLTTAILTQSLSSLQSNIQALGRLRELKDGRNPHYVYLFCEQIEKQQQYHLEKVEIFEQLGLFVHRTMRTAKL